MDFTQVVPDVEKEKFDLVIGLTNAVPEQWIQRTIIQSQWVFCASPGYLEEHGTPKSPKELIHHKMITHSTRTPPNVIKFSSGESICFEPILYFNDTRAMRRAALHGVGIVQLHDYIVAEDLKKKRLIKILGKYTPQDQIPIHISYAHGSHVPMKVRKFVDFIIEIFAHKET